MTFTDFPYYAALLVLMIIMRANRSHTWHLTCLTVASFFLYYTLEPSFVWVLAFLTLCNFFTGFLIEKESSKKTGLWLSFLFNFGTLIALKYSSFMADNLTFLLSWSDVTVPDIPVWLPVGISFFTFQAQSYAIDVYFRVIPAERNLLKFALFVSFFPQLVAGPIVKARHFLPQLKHKPKITIEDVYAGLFAISTGLMLKVVVADNLAHYTISLKAPFFEVRHSLNLLVLSWAFMVQIFGDFAGYSSIAIGLARLFGYRLPINFNAPFIALGFNDFWKRWHITLTNWFKDYLFLRLAMRSRWKGKLYQCLIITFLASGLWHGANWTYVIWGGLQGLGCTLDAAFHRRHGPRYKPTGWTAFCLWAITFQSICFLGVLFYHQDLTPVVGYFQFLFRDGFDQPLLLPRIGDMLFFMFPVFVMHLFALSPKLCKLTQQASIQMLFTSINLILLCLLWGEERGFIYFAF